MKEKVYYTDKKEALTKLNFLRRSLNRKKLPVRAYCDEHGKWHLTKVNYNNTDIEFKELIYAAINYGTSRMLSKNKLNNSEILLLNKLKKIVGT